MPWDLREIPWLWRKMANDVQRLCLSICSKNERSAERHFLRKCEPFRSEQTYLKKRLCSLLMKRYKPSVQRNERSRGMLSAKFYAGCYRYECCHQSLSVFQRTIGTGL